MDAVEIAGVMLIIAMILLVIVLPVAIVVSLAWLAVAAGIGGGILGVLAMAIIALDSM